MNESTMNTSSFPFFIFLPLTLSEIYYKYRVKMRPLIVTIMTSMVA